MAQSFSTETKRSAPYMTAMRIANTVRLLDAEGTFGNALREAMRMQKVTEDELAEYTGNSVKTISRYKNNPDARPDLATVTLLCLALKLEPEISDVLLKFSGNLIPYDPDITFCRELIREKHTYSIDQIDQYLVEQGASPLSKRNTLAQ